MFNYLFTYIHQKSSKFWPSYRTLWPKFYQRIRNVMVYRLWLMIDFKGFFLLRNTGFTQSSKRQYKQAIQSRFSFSLEKRKRRQVKSYIWRESTIYIRVILKERKYKAFYVSLSSYTYVLVSKLRKSTSFDKFFVKLRTSNDSHFRLPIQVSKQK